MPNNPHLEMMMTLSFSLWFRLSVSDHSPTYTYTQQIANMFMYLLYFDNYINTFIYKPRFIFVWFSLAFVGMHAKREVGHVA